MNFLTPKMAGQLLHIGTNKIYKLFHLPGFPSIRIGHQLVVEEESLRKFLREYEGARIALG